MNLIKLIHHIYREHWRRPRKGKACPHCGKKYLNRGPHMSRCWARQAGLALVPRKRPRYPVNDPVSHAEDGDCPIIPGAEGHR